MKKLLICLLISGLSNTISAQWDSYAWFQNQFQNQVIDFAFDSTKVWVLKPDYVMMLDTVSGETQVFNDFVFAENAYFGSNTQFNSILIDENGTVYVNYYGIENGIYTYDGIGWTKHGCPDFPDQNYTGTELMVNTEGHIFIAQTKTIAEFDGNVWETYLSPESIWNGVIDSHDTLWFNSNNGKLFSFYSGTFTLKIPSGIYYSIAIDDHDTLYAVLSSTKILKFHVEIIDTIIAPSSFYFPYLMAADSTGYLYVASYDNHYHKFDGTSWSYPATDIPGNDNNYYSAIGTDDQHNVWLGSYNGYLMKKEDDISSTLYEVNYSGLPDGGNYAVNAFYFDNFSGYGQGFLGTSEGLFRVNYPDHTTAKDESGVNAALTDKLIRCVEKFGNYGPVDMDTAWFGTNEGLFGMDKDFNWMQFTTANSSLPNDTINYILYDADKLWIATNGGAACYHFNGTWETFTTANSPLPANLVHSIFQNFTAVIFCTAHGVAYYGNSNWKIMNTSNSGLIDNDVQAFYTDWSGHNYFGTVSQGICDSISNAGWNYFNTSTGLPSDSILFIAGEYGFGDPLAVGTKGGGILTFENGNYLYSTNYMQGIGFKDATDHSVLQLGEWAEIWITTDKGLLFKDFGGLVPIIASQSKGVSAYFSSENLVINYELKKSDGAQFELFDINGKPLSRVKTFGNSGKNSITLPALRLPEGIYIIRMQSGSQSVSVKALKVR